MASLRVCQGLHLCLRHEIAEKAEKLKACRRDAESQSKPFKGEQLARLRLFLSRLVQPQKTRDRHLRESVQVVGSDCSATLSLCGKLFSSLPSLLSLSADTLLGLLDRREPLIERFDLEQHVLQVIDLEVLVEDGVQ